MGNREIAHDTLERTEEIVSSTSGASLDSEFLNDSQLPKLDRDGPNHPPALIQVVNADSFTLARQLIKDIPGAKGKVAVLNLASDAHPGGGWIHTLSKTQEEALCYSSTLFKTLREEWYPWPNSGPHSIAGIYSPAVVIFKNDLDHNCVDLPPAERDVVAVLTVSAPCVPELTEDFLQFMYQDDLENLRSKVRLILRMAARKGKDTLVLGAFGCGAYCCPPRQVATEMKNILLEDEFKGWFRQVAFAVYSRQTAEFVGADNFRIFSQVMQEVKV